MINWSLLGQQTNPGDAFVAGFERAATRSALSQVMQGSDDPRAWGVLSQFAPEMAMRAQNHRYQQDERQRVANARGALSDYVLGNGTPGPLGVALPSNPAAAGVVAPAPGAPVADPPASTPSALSPGAGVLSGAAPAPQPSALGALAPAPAALQPVAASSAELAPKPGEDPWSRAVRLDPEAALEIQGRQFQNQRQRVQLTQDQFELLRDTNEDTLRLLGGIEQVPEAQRPAAWRAAIGEAQSLYGRIGIDVTDRLPAEYDPVAYDRLMRAALKTRDRFAVMNAENRLDWDIEDDEIDNRRADRGMDSLEQYRRDQIRLGMRGQDLTDARGRRGQDITSSDRRRGQDIGSSDRRRGQDQSSSDRRRGQDMRGRGGRGRAGNRGGGTGQNARYRNPQNGKEVEWNGSAWVEVR